MDAIATTLSIVIVKRIVLKRCKNDLVLATTDFNRIGQKLMTKDIHKCSNDYCKP